MKKNCIYVDLSAMDWVKSREKVHRKNVELYNGLRMSMVHFEPGHTSWLHEHAAEQTIFVIKGTCDVRIEGNSYLMGAESMLTIPPWAHHEVVCGEDGPVELISIFSPVEPGLEKKPEVLPQEKPYVFCVGEREWAKRKEKVSIKVYQGARGITVSYVQLDPGHEPNPHSHEDIQVVLCLKNKTTYYVEGKPHDLHQGVVIASAPWVVHNSHNTYKQPVTDLEIFWPKRTKVEEALPKG